MEIKLGPVSIHLGAGVAVANVPASFGFQHVKFGLDGIARLTAEKGRGETTGGEGESRGMGKRSRDGKRN